MAVFEFDFTEVAYTRTPPVEAALIPVTTPSQPLYVQCKHAHFYRSASAPGWPAVTETACVTDNLVVLVIL